MDESEKGELIGAYPTYNRNNDGAERFSAGYLSTLCQFFTMSSDW
jgi:hypothetical protein